MKKNAGTRNRINSQRQQHGFTAHRRGTPWLDVVSPREGHFACLPEYRNLCGRPTEKGTQTHPFQAARKSFALLSITTMSQIQSHLHICLSSRSLITRRCSIAGKQSSGSRTIKGVVMNEVENVALYPQGQGASIGTSHLLWQSGIKPR